MMSCDWPAVLVLALLLFLILEPVSKGQGTRCLVLAGAFGLACLPVREAPLALQFRGLTHDLSDGLLVLLLAATLARFGLVHIERRCKAEVLAVFALLALLLYPASLGLSYVDPYRWGYEPGGLLLAMAVLTLAFLLRGNWLGVAVLLLATLAYALRQDGPGNYWNYLIDPLLGLFALGWWLVTGVVAGVRLLRSRRFLSTQVTRTVL